ncbi:peptidyl-prolyl cis-trans isomerase, partial [Mesorhizobium sp. M00.F.Ca.ET.158.01.1.1]
MPAEPIILLKRLLREPLAHFIILALAIFSVYGLLN